jgi:pimeloyl-ACP methyl ester carboxylesterase
MTADSTSPDTIVLIHGLWMTPRSWEEWVPYYESKGYGVLTPTYPGFEVEVEALRADPSVIAELTVPQTVAHIAETITELDQPPIIMGHSFGGTLTQLLLNRGCGAVGVAINSAPTEGVHVSPPSQIRSLFPILKNPANRDKAVGFTPEEFHYAFANTLSEEESAKVYERYHIPAPGNWVWAYGLIANFKPGHQETWVNYKNDSRAPLLFIAGGEDNIMPPSVNRSNAKHYKSNTITDYFEFPGRSHWTCGEPGWEAVADYALEWAVARATGTEVPAAAPA